MVLLKRLKHFKVATLLWLCWVHLDICILNNNVETLDFFVLGHSQRVLHGALNPKNTQIFSAGADQRLRVWDLWTLWTERFQEQIPLWVLSWNWRMRRASLWVERWPRPQIFILWWSSQILIWVSLGFTWFNKKKPIELVVVQCLQRDIFITNDDFLSQPVNSPQTPSQDHRQNFNMLLTYSPVLFLGWTNIKRWVFSPEYVWVLFSYLKMQVIWMKPFGLGSSVATCISRKQ